jgi:hypothetical protein
VAAEFFYGFGNNYAGANLCNLDVFLASLRKQAPAARVIVLVGKEHAYYVPLLAERYPLFLPMTPLISVLDLAGTLVVALSGGLAAARIRLDPFGFAVVAVATGLAT